jgi:putative hydrolase of the HAD superfamily
MALPRAIFIDVGFTLLFPDGSTIASLARGAEVDPAELDRVEPILRAELARHVWASRPSSDAPKDGGPRFFHRFLELAGARGDLPGAATAIWEAHLRRNVWRRPADRALDALARLHAARVKLAAVSNSEGTVEQLLVDVGMGAYLDTVVDSWVVELAKPDPRIFRLALDRLGVRAEETVMVGDSLSADVGGARAAGLRGAVLIDPLDLHLDADVPRHATFAGWVDTLLK